MLPTLLPMLRRPAGITSGHGQPRSGPLRESTRARGQQHQHGDRRHGVPGICRGVVQGLPQPQREQEHRPFSAAETANVVGLRR